MTYLRTRISDFRLKSLSVSKEIWPSYPRYNRTYNWTTPTRLLGDFKCTQDNPAKLLALEPDSSPKRLAKGTDPSEYFNAAEPLLQRYGFSVLRHKGVVTVPWVEFTVWPSDYFYVVYQGSPLPQAGYTNDTEIANYQSGGWSAPEPKPRIADFVLASALAKMGEPQNDYAVPLAELRETLKFLVSPIKSLLRLNQKRNLLDSTWAVTRRGGLRFVNHPNKSIARRLKNYSWAKDLKESPSHISDFWLGYRYGLEPLVRDCDTVLQHAWHGIGHTNGIFSKRARYVEKTERTIDSYVTLDPSLALTFRDTVQIEDATRAHVLARRRVIGGYWEQMLDIGLNPFSAPTIAWEVTPLSFVLDRFVNIGTWLSAQTYRPDTHYLGNTVSRHYKITVVRSARNLIMAGKEIDASRVGTFTWTFDGYVRVPNWTIPTTPVWNPRPLNLSQWLDHLTISWQRMPKFVKD